MAKIKIGQVGLGRLGKVHAENIVNHVKGAELFAVASVVEQELAYAKEELGVKNCYTSYSEMMRKRRAWGSCNCFAEWISCSSNFTSIR